MPETTPSLQTRITRLYRGRSQRARRFRYSLLLFDLMTIAFFILSSTLQETTWIYVTDFFIGLVILADFAARLWIEPERKDFFTQFTTWADVVVIVSLLLPVLVENFLFLRVLRALRLMRSYHVLRDLRTKSRFFRRNEQVIQSVVNLAVFIFIVTALVYVLQGDENPQINNYIDALYFTIATLTTTGFGDITLTGTEGHLIAVIIMVVGVALFLRLVQTIFRPAKIRYKCPECGLNRHDLDAVHCKHCGHLLDIETEGLD